MKPKHAAKHGFTLIEILIVLVIIGLLAGLLFPVFSSARENARTTACASNLKQIGQAMTLYLQDNSQRYPLSTQPPGCTWVDSIYPYIKSTQVFSCPSAQYGEYTPGCVLSEFIEGSSPRAEYGRNGSYDLVAPFISVKTEKDANGATLTDHKIPDKSFAASRYRFPSNTILVLDGSDDYYAFHSRYALVNPGIDPIGSVEDLKEGGVLPRHKDGVNLLYVDGHVKWQKLQSLASTPMWRYDGREATPASTP